MNETRQVEERHFVEEFGILFEQAGLPRMAGRILGRLLISDPPHQSTDELAEALLASKGSISTMTRYLIQAGLIERLGLPGVRHDYFRLRPGALNHLMKQRADQITEFRRLVERALGLLDDKPSLTRQWLEEARDVYAFFEREFAVLAKRWEQEREKRQP